MRKCSQALTVGDDRLGVARRVCPVKPRLGCSGAEPPADPRPQGKTRRGNASLPGALGRQPRAYLVGGDGAGSAFRASKAGPT
jgi:hypothetical protein